MRRQVEKQQKLELRKETWPKAKEGIGLTATRMAGTTGNLDEMATIELLMLTPLQKPTGTPI